MGMHKGNPTTVGDVQGIAQFCPALVPEIGVQLGSKVNQVNNLGSQQHCQHRYRSPIDALHRKRDLVLHPTDSEDI